MCSYYIIYERVRLLQQAHDPSRPEKLVKYNAKNRHKVSFGCFYVYLQCLAYKLRKKRQLDPKNMSKV